LQDSNSCLRYRSLRKLPVSWTAQDSTLRCMWRRLWALVRHRFAHQRCAHNPCKPSHIFFRCNLQRHSIPANNKLLGYVNSCCEFSPPILTLHQFSVGAFSLTSPSVTSPSPPLFTYSRHPRPSDPIPQSARRVTSAENKRIGLSLAQSRASRSLYSGAEIRNRGTTKPLSSSVPPLVYKLT
jgi:hypothetical protein